MIFSKNTDILFVEEGIKMKNYTKIKTIQLAIFAILTVFGLVTIFFHTGLYQKVSADPDVLILCLLLWCSYGLTFVFIYLDLRFLSTYRNNYSELDQAVHTDTVAGIANRYSCDAIIEKYADQPLPDNIASIMFDLSNIQEINEKYGHAAGNRAIRDFSNLIKMASFNYCFVGRNGGNKFLALFEDATDNNINAFLSKLDQKILEHNQENPDMPIEFRLGIAYKEGPEIKTINELIALSNKRMYEA